MEVGVVSPAGDAVICSQCTGMVVAGDNFLEGSGWNQAGVCRTVYFIAPTLNAGVEAAYTAGEAIFPYGYIGERRNGGVGFPEHVITPARECARLVECTRMV